MGSYFYFSSTITDFIFPGWNVYTAAGVFGTCVAVMVFAIVYEGVRLLRRLIYNRSSSKIKTKSERLPLHNGQVSISFQRRLFFTLIQSGLYMVQIFFLYMMMLSIMSYNAWIGIATVVGMGLGYFLTGPWSFADPYEEHGDAADQILTQIPPSRSYSSTNSENSSTTSSLSVTPIALVENGVHS